MFIPAFGGTQAFCPSKVPESTSSRTSSATISRFGEKRHRSCGNSSQTSRSARSTIANAGARRNSPSSGTDQSRVNSMRNSKSDENGVNSPERERMLQLSTSKLLLVALHRFVVAFQMTPRGSMTELLANWKRTSARSDMPFGSLNGMLISYAVAGCSQLCTPSEKPPSPGIEVGRSTANW